MIIIASKKLFLYQVKKFKFSRKVNFVNLENLKKNELRKRSINFIDIPIKNIKNSKIYIENSFNTAFKILKSGLTNKLINGPINKVKFLNQKYLGITEYIAQKFFSKKIAMLIYNQKLSVCPITTHLPLKLVSRKINQTLINEKVFLIHDFYKKNFKFKPKIAITGLNPHCESILKINEDKRIIVPAVNSLRKKGFNIKGPFQLIQYF